MAIFFLLMNPDSSYYVFMLLQ